MRCNSNKLVTDMYSAEIFCSNCGFVVPEKLKHKKRFYPIYIDPQESKILRTLEQKTSRLIILSLIKNIKISLEDLASQNNVDPEFLFPKLSYLINEGVLKTEHLGKNQTYQLADKSQISKIIMKYVLE